MSINYALANRQYRFQKSALTRAVNKWRKTGDANPVIDACIKAINEWKEWGAWPDGWHNWNIALQDAADIDMHQLEREMR